MNFCGTKFVFLNCCSSGTGNVTKEGVLGFVSSFFQSGVPTIIAPLKRVENTIASKIGIGFFEYYSSGKFSKA